MDWILHAATQDLPCLSELGMWPDKLFDTELAARLAGLPRVGLAAVIESLLGLRLAKEHSAADWSTRPLPEPWLRYAALDVEVLTELREELIELLEADGKLDYAEQEFEAVLEAGQAPPRVDPWRRTSGLHQIRDRRQLAAVRELWLERDALAQKRDVAPGRLIPDSALVAAAKAMPTTVPQLLDTKGFHGRAAQREAPRWLRCISTPGTSRISRPCTCPPTLPRRRACGRTRTRRPRHGCHRPAPAAVQGRGLEHAGGEPADAGLPAPRLVAPAGRVDEEGIAEALPNLGARQWQIDLVAPLITEAFQNPQPSRSRKPRRRPLWRPGQPRIRCSRQPAPTPGNFSRRRDTDPLPAMLLTSNMLSDVARVVAPWLFAPRARIRHPRLERSNT